LVFPFAQLDGIGIMILLDRPLSSLRANDLLRPGGNVSLTVAATKPSRRKTRIHPTSGWRAIDLAELWQYRELLWVLAARDI